jgi:integrase/recombinase XerC
MVLLSFKAGLRAKEIAGLTWSMVTDATGQLADAISLPNKASKGKAGGRTIPLHSELRAALVRLKAVRGTRLRPQLPVVYGERADGYSANAIAVWFLTRFREIGIEGASSHSGRRTFIRRPRKRLLRQAAACGTSRNWLVTLPSRPRSGIFRATARPNATSSL